ncbi:MAG: hypothetical protein ACJ779_12520 [Chloroflexota bacterium]
MDIPLDRRTIADPRPHRSACLVAGCPCKDPRIISRRRVAFYAEWARRHGETADRRVEPDPAWASFTRPWRERLSARPERPGLEAMTKDPSATKAHGW